MTSSKLGILFLWCMLLFSCASIKHERIITKDIYRQCSPTESMSTVTTHKIEIEFARYEKCYGYEDLMIISWTPLNTTDARVLIHYILAEYLQRQNKKARLIQHEQWGKSFFVLYELVER